MSELHTSIHDLPGGGIMARCEQDFRGLVDEYAERIQRGVDAAALDKAAGALAEFGYVKVVRCRDCARFVPQGAYRLNGGVVNKDTCDVIRGFVVQIDPDGFCAWGERRVDA